MAAEGELAVNHDRRGFLVLTLAAVIGIASPDRSYAEETGPIAPQQIASRNPYRRTPLWVSAAVAVDAAGNLVPSYFTDAEQSLQHDATDAMSKRHAVAAATTISSNRGQCDYTYTQLIDESADMIPSISLEELLKRPARRVFAGEIIGEQLGFVSGLPATLIALRLERDSRKEWAKSVVFIGYPRASVVTASGTLCSSFVDYLPAPSVGDRLVIVSFSEGDDPDGVLFRVAPTNIFIERSFGAFDPPRRLSRDLEAAGIRSLADVKKLLSVSRANPERGRKNAQ
jgi:hypothetical protein